MSNYLQRNAPRRYNCINNFAYLRLRTISFCDALFLFAFNDAKEFSYWGYSNYLLNF